MKLKLNRLILYCCILIAGPLQALPAEPRFRHYGTVDGLSQGSVFSMTQDSRGFMWFGTLDGLNRFDGYNFRVFRPSYGDSSAIAGGRINSIIEDKGGMIWVGTDEALNRYNFRTNRFTHFYLPDDLHRQHKTRYDPFFIDDRNELWFTYDYEDLASLNLVSGKITTYAFAHGALQEFTTAGYPEKMFYRPLSAIYSAGSDGLRVIDVIHRSVSSCFSSASGNRLGKKTGIGQLLADQSGTLWLASDEGLISLEPVSGRVQRYHPAMTRNKSVVLFGLALDRDGNLWCGSDGDGLLLFNTRTRAFSRQYLRDIANPGSLGGNNLACLFIDRDRNLWMGVDQIGVDKINPDYEQLRHVRITPKSQPGSYIGSVWAITEIDRDRLLVCSNYKDLFIYQQAADRFTAIILPGAFNGSTVFSMLRDSHKRLWLATGEGLLYSDDQLKHIRVFRRQNFYDVFLFECNQRILVAGNNQLFSVPVNEPAGQLDTVHAFDGFPVNSIARSPNGLLAVSAAEGQLILATLSGTKAQVVKKTSFDFHIKSVLFQDENTLWLGTSLGLARYKIQTGAVKLYTEKVGLANNLVYCLLWSADRHLWMSTNHGISRFAPARESFSNYGLAEGTQSLEFNAHSCHRSLSGLLYFGGVQGFNYFDPRKVKDIPFDPPLEILNVAVNGQVYSPYTFSGHTRPAELQSRQNNISVEFAAIDFNRNDNINYLYRLHSGDTWRSAGRQRSLDFVNLPAGDYFLQIRAQYSNSGMSPHMLKLAFRILQPFYRTTWFTAACLLLLVLLAYSIYRYRIRQLLKILAIRNAIARDLHDDIGSTLGSINIYSEVAARELRERHGVQAQAVLEKMGVASRELTERMNDIVWSINGDKDNFSDLSGRMQDFAAAMLAARGIKLTFTATEGTGRRRFSIRQRKNIFLIFKEAVHNLAKYARAQNVTIALAADDRFLSLSITDDGNGFDLQEAARRRGNGLGNMQARAKEIGAKIKISSAAKKGTSVELIMPLR